MWVWGKLSVWFLRQHIARELRPHCEASGVDRETAYQVSCSKLRKHFDTSWPQPFGPVEMRGPGVDAWNAQQR